MPFFKAKEEAREIRYNKRKNKKKVSSLDKIKSC
jgi:hypothetical protein